MVHSVAQLLDDGQVPADSVEPVNTETCGGRGETGVKTSRTPQEDPPGGPPRGVPQEEQGPPPPLPAPTVGLHVVDAHQHEGRHRGALPVAQVGQAAAEHLI